LYLIRHTYTQTHTPTHPPTHTHLPCGQGNETANSPTRARYNPAASAVTHTKSSRPPPPLYFHSQNKMIFWCLFSFFFTSHSLFFFILLTVNRNFDSQSFWSGNWNIYWFVVTFRFNSKKKCPNNRIEITIWRFLHKQLETWVLHGQSIYPITAFNKKLDFNEWCKMTNITDSNADRVNPLTSIYHKLFGKTLNE
jgi:hypothetical protein